MAVRRGNKLPAIVFRQARLDASASMFLRPNTVSVFTHSLMQETKVVFIVPKMPAIVGRGSASIRGFLVAVGISEKCAAIQRILIWFTFRMFRFIAHSTVA